MEHILESKATPFDKAMEFVGLWEWGNRADGGYTNDPVDPGGETKWGISKRAHPDLDIKNLSKEKAFEVYKQVYWSGMGCDAYRVVDACAAFDTAVNIGIAKTAIFLDGSKDYKDVLEQRKKYYQALVVKKPLLTKYLKGWLNRVNALHMFCDGLAKKA